MIICSLFIGSILGVVISLALVIKTRRNMAKLRRQIKETEQEVNNLRTLPIKDSH
jgi:putative membrane protein